MAGGRHRLRDVPVAGRATVLVWWKRIWRGDPLYEVRRLLRRRADRLSPNAIVRLDTALRAGDPDGQVTTAWWCAQQVALGYAIRQLAAGKPTPSTPSTPSSAAPCPRSGPFPIL
jgi:hypothetical protein